MRIKCILIVLSLSISFLRANVVSCHIDVSIKGMENKNIMFAGEYGKKQIIIDTLKCDKTGRGFYESKKRLPSGIYTFIFSDQKYIEVLINDEQFITISSDTSDLFGKLAIDGSDESDLYRQYQAMALQYEKLEKEVKITRKNSDSTQIKALNSKIAELHDRKKQINDWSAKTLKEKPQSFLAAYLKMKDEPNFKDDSGSDNHQPGKDLFTKRYVYIKNHYFDNVPFNDTRLLHTRLIYEKLEYYFNIFTAQNADSLCNAAKKVLLLAKINEESYRFVLNFLNYNYRNPKDADQEKVFVFIADNYYLNNNATWADPKYLKLLQEKVDALKPTMLGAKAANLDLQTLEGNPVSVYGTKANLTIILFWSPDCGVCTSEIHKLYESYTKYKSKGIKFIAVYVHADKEMWKKYLNDNKFDWINVYDPFLKSNFSKLYNVTLTPKLYILDSDKKIVAKDLKPIQFNQFLADYK